jgi:hypothetical protein
LRFDLLTFAFGGQTEGLRLEPFAFARHGGLDCLEFFSEGSRLNARGGFRFNAGIHDRELRRM